MLTKLIIKNFKRFDEIEIDLDQSVVFIGPNNSGKTTALQALSLWNLGLRRWLDKQNDTSKRSERTGTVINRRDLVSVPVPTGKLLWKDISLRKGVKKDGKQITQNINIEIIVEGYTDNKKWECGLEFTYANEEAIYVRPIFLNSKEQNWRDQAKLASGTKIAFLPPMSGLASQEFTKSTGEIAVLIGQGQTAQILRNLCLQVFNSEDPDVWNQITKQMSSLFGVDLLDPSVSEFDEISLNYRDKSKKSPLDLSCSGRGMQQTLLMLTYLYSNKNSVLLLDEPDAHLEILRQKQIFKLLKEVARQQRGQLLIASHSEAVLNEAAEKDVVIAFTGKPHIINSQKLNRVKPALNEMGWEHYYQAEQKGWVFYTEGSTDEKILLEFAKKLNHPLTEHLIQQPYIHPLGINKPSDARKHFETLLEAKPDLVGIALFDNLDREPQSSTELTCLMWSRREIENYFCHPDTFLNWAKDLSEKGDLFFASAKEDMQKTLDEFEKNFQLDKNMTPWDSSIKVTEKGGVIESILNRFCKTMATPVPMNKGDFCQLVKYLPDEQIDPEIKEKLDAILAVVNKATPCPN